MDDKIDMMKYRLGSASAWDQIEVQEMLNARQGFLPIQQLTDISDSQFVFLCGRRGAGKSAIAIKLAEDKRWTYREAVEGERSHYGEYLEVVEKLSNEKDKGAQINIEKAVRLLWEWVLPVKSMQTVVKQAEAQGEPEDKELSEMKKYLHGLPSGLHIESRMGDMLTVMFQTALNSPNGLESNLLNLTGEPGFISAIEAFARKTKFKKVLVVIDTLESYKVLAPFMIDGFRGILQAVITLLTDPRMWGVSFKLFVPAEVYEQAISKAPGKLGDRTVFMRWRAADLISVLSGRFLNVLRKNDSVPPQLINKLDQAVSKAYQNHDGRHLKNEFWYDNSFLPRKIHNAIGKDEDCFAFLLRHTFRKPRDLVIHQMQEIVDNAVRLRTFPIITESDVINGVHDSFILMKILGDAMSAFDTAVPGDVVSNARQIFYGNPSIMNGRQLKRFSNQLYTLHRFDVEPERFVQLLLRCGVVGLPLDLKSDLYTKAKFEYMMPDNLPDVRDETTYCVHPVMADLFKMQAPESGKSVYPLSEQDQWLEESANI